MTVTPHPFTVETLAPPSDAAGQRPVVTEEVTSEQHLSQILDEAAADRAPWDEVGVTLYQSPRRWLCLTVGGGMSAMVWHDDDTAEDLYSRGEDPSDEEVPLHLFDDWFYPPRSALVPAHSARGAAMEFLRTGRRPDVPWQAT